MRVEATVVLPCRVIIDVSDDMSIENIRDRVIEQADMIYESSGIKAIIHDSNIPELID